MQPTRYLSGVLALVLAFANVNCSVNILSTFANQKSDESLYYDALADMNGNNYNGALTYISQMSTSYAAGDKVLRLQASAYAGLCGFQFIPFSQNFGNIGATLLLPFLLSQIPTTVGGNIDDCVTAQNTILSITDPSNDDYMFLALIALAKVGVILSYTNGNGTATPNTTTWDACAVNGGARSQGGTLTDSDAREIGTGITLALMALGKLAGSVNLGQGSTTNINSVCTKLANPPVPAGYDFCTVTTPGGFTPTEVKGIRSLIKENNAVGIGAECSGDITTCNCP